MLDLIFDIYDQASIFDVHLAILKVIQVWINRKVYDINRLQLLKRRLMLKAAISQEELDGKPRTFNLEGGIAFKQLQGKEVPQVMVELSQAH